MPGITPETLELARKTAESMEQFSKALIALNDEPNSAPPVPAITQGIGEGLQAAPRQSRLLSGPEMFGLRRELRTKTTPELEMLFAEQARQKGTGVPLDMWLNRGGYAAQSAFSQIAGQVDPDIARAIDTGASAALIRQDLEPVLYELFVRTFPAFERFRKEPANGLTHTYNQITAYGDAQFMGELGTVTDDASTYVRQTTNVAILATRRGVSLKSTFAIAAGGMSYNAEQLELQGGLRAMSHKMQQTIFGGHGTDSGGTAANELGLYDANGFTGLRSILNTARAKHADLDASTPDSFRRAINQACVEIMQAGGQAGIVWGNPFEKEKFDNQQDQNVRYMNNLVDVAVGVTTNAINTVFGPLPFAVVPGDSISAYAPATPIGGYTTVRDVYVLDESTISLPYLGTDGPTVLDIPIGISGQLVHLYIIFGMWGLAVKAPQFSNKVRVKVS